MVMIAHLPQTIAQSFSQYNIKEELVQRESIPRTADQVGLPHRLNLIYGAVTRLAEIKQGVKLCQEFIQ
jgi:hypothetical protein